MVMFFTLLGLFGFFIFLIWVIIALITKNQKRIPTIGFVISVVILATVVSIPMAVSAFNVNKVNSNSGEMSNYKVSKETGLEIVTSKVKIEPNLKVLYDSQRNIKEKIYYLYTLNTEEYTLEDVAYCVDVNSGELFKCSIDMSLSPIE
ncbi:hypothetical protein [Clostridium tagluense]|uniref:hypothetical protein n=1 Tax=Clostridium tagluense TaxID=360422 RepID=UPI001C0B8A07|nr:hypothetical protein [Clostridium tagluense]MBU3126332.1 hypothetical protein [Clostridium tagluense]